MRHRWINGLLCGILLLLPGTAIGQQSDARVIIVKSSDNAYFNQTIETLINHVDPATKFRIVMAKDLVDGREDAKPGGMFVALGQSAVQAVNALDGSAASINAYLTLEQYRKLNLEHQETVLLDQPLHRYLAFCKLLMAADSVGIVVDRQLELSHDQVGLLDDIDLVLNRYQVDPLNKLLPLLRRLLQQNDALLMLPRQSIYNRDSLKGVLLTSYRSRKPVISYSPAHVKSGALASIYSSPVDIGRQLSSLVNQQLQNPARRGLPFQFARFYSIATNQRVAHALGLELADEGELRTGLDKLGP